MPLGISSIEALSLVTESPPELVYILLAVSIIAGCLCCLAFIRGTKM